MSIRFGWHFMSANDTSERAFLEAQPGRKIAAVDAAASRKLRGCFKDASVILLFRLV
jgi:hypothetical protein